jgi:hypothetical protein
MYFLSLWSLVRPMNTQLQKDNSSPTFTTQCIWCVCLIVRICLIRCSTSYGEGCWWSELVKCISLFNTTSKISEWETIFFIIQLISLFGFSVHKKSFRYCQILIFFNRMHNFYCVMAFLQKHGRSLKDEWILSLYYYSSTSVGVLHNLFQTSCLSVRIFPSTIHTS